jgi:transposase
MSDHIVQNYLQQEAIELLPWPVMSPDMNPVKHLWNYLEQKVNALTPFMIQSITSLTASYPVQFLNTSHHSLNQASQSVLRVLLPFLHRHPLTSRPILMDVNVRTHRACIVQSYLQQEAIELLHWPTMSPDMNPVEHLWNYVGRKVNVRTIEAQLMSRGSDHGTFVLLNSHQVHTSHAYSLAKGIPKQ